MAGLPRSAGRRRQRAAPWIASAVGALAGAALLASNFHGFVAPRGPGVLAGSPPRESARSGSALRLFAASGAGLAANAKAKLLDLLEDEAVQQEVLRPEGKPTRGRVDESIVALERFNPTDEPVYSELLDGAWNVKYAGTYAPGLLSSPTRELALLLYGGGFSLGNAISSFAEGFWGQSLGVKVGAKSIRIEAGRDVDAKAEVTLAGSKETLAYKAELLPLSAARMSEEIMSVDLPGPLGTQQPPLELRRSLLVTYLDEEVMVVRDESGVPEVLVREAQAPMAQADDISLDSPSMPAPEVEVVDGEDPLSSEAA